MKFNDTNRQIHMHIKRSRYFRLGKIKELNRYASPSPFPSNKSMSESE